MKKRFGRAIAVSAVFLAVCSAFVLRLVDLQIINGEEYLEKSMNRVVTKSTVKAARGEILDRNCRPIVQNKRVFTIEFNLSSISDMNKTIDKMITIFEESGQTYKNTFPISLSAPYVYSEDFLTSESSVAEFEKFLSGRKIKYGAADEVVEGLIKYYGLGDYPKERAVKIAAVRYDISLHSSGSYYTFATNISIETVTAVKENIEDIYGVYIEEEPVRVYTEENFASHIIGYVGMISSSEYSELKSDGYAMDDYVGKDGIERIMESYLRGENGYKYAVRDITGSTTDIIENVEPKAGNDVILTIDKNLQLIVEDSLDTVIDKIKEINGEEAANSASAVFLEVGTGDVLAMASAPTFNLATFYEDYSTLSKEGSGNPYMNRAISGTFAPGSTFKMVSAIATLESGIISPTYTYRCTGAYDYYRDITFACFNSRAHGTENVAVALQKSCNIFFFDAVRRLGIDEFNKYGKLLGFGEKTGIDLYGESKGILAGNEYRQNTGQPLMKPGEVLLAAIGQSDNTVTPLQLANYVATIANGGVRMVPHVVKSVRNRDTGEVILETSPEVAADMELKQSTIDVVTEGMKMVAQSGGGLYSAFKDYTITTVAVKTGTAEVSGGLPNALVVGFAPAENPQVAFAVVIENGGINVAPVISEVIKNGLSYYFSNMNSLDSVSPEGEINP